MQALEGLKVVVMAGLAPSAYSGMFLADFGADVIIVDRPTKRMPEVPFYMEKNPLDRGKRSMRINIKDAEGKKILQKLIEGCDVLMEAYRPGVMESLGFGPDAVLKINPRLIFARLTGWGQTGPHAHMAGHDINYIAASGALSLIRRKGEKPLQPGNLLGDFAGGGMLCVIGILMALFERSKSGKGQVIDAAMVDGAAHLSTYFHALLGHNHMSLDIGTNALDTGSYFYQTYETADKKFMAVGALEERFYLQLLEGLGLDPEDLPPQQDKEKWPEMTKFFTKIFKSKTQAQWISIFDNKDACVTPVVELDEVGAYPHNASRNAMIEIDGIPQPAPAPRLSRTPGKAFPSEESRGYNTIEILKELGYSEQKIEMFFQKEVVE